ncbi:MAG: WYL domain-containing protein [Lachnospiraceae bacterium]|nr:WYL domain-containing protein [Lachnospiraceae bacterium]
MRCSNQKLKLLYLQKILREQTDDTHALTMAELIDELGKYGIEAARKSIYDDIAALNDYGIEVLKYQKGLNTYYHCGSRDFEVAELHIIIDAIASSKFITVNKAKDLIKKLENMVSIYDKKLLERNVVVSGRITNMNGSTIYAVDEIQNAIANNHRVKFQYFSWNVDGERELRHDGKIYEISPWTLVWDNENYYMVGYDSEVDDFRTFRVDKMIDAKEVKTKRAGATQYRQKDKNKYSRMRFRMYDGEEQKITLRCDNDMANVIYDQFGHGINVVKTNNGYFKANVNVAVSDMFLGWILALGGKVVIESPKSVRERFVELMKMNMDSMED